MADQSLKGTNWGTLQIDEKNLSLQYLNRNVLKFPLKKIVNSNIQKNDIVLQLNTDENANNEDMLCEVRFYIPPIEKKIKKKVENENNEENESDSEPIFQQVLQSQILTKANIGGSSDSILTIHDVPLIVPRGKYTMDFFKQDLRFHGNTYQFTTTYKSISRFFLLPMPDEVNLSFVIGLDNPVKQGLTAYHFILMQFKKDIEDQVKLKYTREKLDELGWKGIKQEYSGSLFDIVCEVLSEITGIKVISPKNFKSRDGLSCLRCSVVPHSGHLFPLEKSLLFIQKPVLYIRHEDIKEVILQRITQSNQNKSFEIKVIAKNGPFLFSTIDRDELDNLTNYFTLKKIPIKKVQEEGLSQLQADETEGKSQPIDLNMDSDEDDEDFQAADDSFDSVQFQDKMKKGKNK